MTTNNPQLPAQRPLHMLPDQLAGMILTPAQTGANAGTGGLADATDDVQRIPHRHGHIPQPARMADAANRAAFGDAQKFFFGPVEQGHRKNWNLTPITRLLPITTAPQPGQRVPTAEYAIGQTVQARYGGEWIRARVNKVTQLTGPRGPEVAYEVSLDNSKRGIVPSRMLRPS